MSEEIILIVNGKPHKVQAEPGTALLYVLRNELGLTGPQFGCGEETCGACMVLIGDQAKPSCKLPVSQVGRSRITTLEGLMAENELHPVQRAFLEEQASQCGYCLNGMIITTAALLWKTPHPSDRQIRGPWMETCVAAARIRAFFGLCEERRHCYLERRTSG